MQTRVVPEVVDDPSLPLERCVLETSLGQTELGVEPQLKEIERGLLDLLAQRPTEKA
jgi:flagellar biosynthesis/type III secretory pathway protein FliH